MKKLLSLLLALTLALSLFAACGNNGNGGEVEPEPEPPYTPNLFTGAQLPDGYPTNQRPIAIMINNYKGSRPQSGLEVADITYEIVTEGGITRMMCVYSDYERLNGVNVGPVRSARDQHVQLMLPFQPIYMHVGGSPQASALLRDYGYETREIDANYKSVQDVAMFFDNARWNSGYASEHCWYTTGELIQDAIDTFDLLGEGSPDDPIFNFVHYNHAPRELMGGLATSFNWDFSSETHAAMEYDPMLNQYMKSEFGTAQIDGNSGRQLGYTNVVILFTNMQLYPDKYLTKVDYEYGGFGFYFYGGRYEQVRWVKGTPTQPLRIVDAQGNEIDIELNVGNSYIAIVDYSFYDAFVATFENEGPVPGQENPEGDASGGESQGE
ncbi:DUF3048 domain-containing protein [Ruminococcaceae bacterium OttesenSCG-928-N02]|nr:DUF3048 domain-containing protein [Ruminococcaceae bacterium OttesenSCG-928-N02]